MDSKGEWISREIANKRCEEMDKEIIRRFNERVKPEDMVYFLGDFCFKSGSSRGEGLPNKAQYYSDQLNCKNIIFCRGNHDGNNGIKSITESLQIKYAREYYNLVHFPADANTLFKINFVGHIHEKWKFKRLTFAMSTTDMINVGVDVNGFYPKTIEELLKEHKQWKLGRIDYMGKKI